MFVKHVNTFLEFFEKSFDFEKNEAQNLAGILCQNLIFGLNFFFPKVFRKCFVTFTSMFKVSERYGKPRFFLQ